MLAYAIRGSQTKYFLIECFDLYNWEWQVVMVTGSDGQTGQSVCGG